MLFRRGRGGHRQGHPAETLDVDVDELTWPFADIPDRDAGQPVGVTETTVAVPARDAIDRRSGMAQERTQPMGPDAQAPPGEEDLSDLPLGQRPRSTTRPRRAVLGPRGTLEPIPAQPLVRGRPADPTISAAVAAGHPSIRTRSTRSRRPDGVSLAVR